MEQAHPRAVESIRENTIDRVRQRLPHITNLQNFAIFLVVLGHCTPTNNWRLVPPFMMWLIKVIYSFHLPLFMFISGFLFMYSWRGRSIDYVDFIYKKIKRLLLPYLVFSTLAFLLKNAFSQYAIRKISFTLDSYLAGIFYPEDNPMINLWFLPTLFIIFLIAPFLKRVIENGRKAVLSLILLLILLLNSLKIIQIELLNISGAVYFLIFFYLGGIAGRYHEKLIMCKHYAFLAVSLMLLGVTNLIDFRLGVLAPLVGIAFSYSLSHFLGNSSVRAADYIDGYYYQIFLMSWFVQVFIRAFYRVGMLDYWPTVFLMLFGGLYIPVFVARLVQRKSPELKAVFGM
ncbi:MAG: acyltransferase [Nitrospirota bacterium]